MNETAGSSAAYPRRARRPAPNGEVLLIREIERYSGRGSALWFMDFIEEPYGWRHYAMKRAAAIRGDVGDRREKTRSRKGAKIFWSFGLVLRLVPVAFIEDEEEDEDDQPAVGGSLH